MFQRQLSDILHISDMPLSMIGEEKQHLCPVKERCSCRIYTNEGSRHFFFFLLFIFSISLLRNSLRAGIFSHFTSTTKEMLRFPASSFG